MKHINDEKNRKNITGTPEQERERKIERAMGNIYRIENEMIMVFLVMHSEFEMDPNAKRLAGPKILMCAHLQSAHLSMTIHFPNTFEYLWEKQLNNNGSGIKKSSLQVSVCVECGDGTFKAAFENVIVLLRTDSGCAVHCADVSLFFFRYLNVVRWMQRKETNSNIYFFMNKCLNVL